LQVFRRGDALRRSEGAHHARQAATLRPEQCMERRRRAWDDM
jgi:hypothetical protein